MLDKMNRKTQETCKKNTDMRKAAQEKRWSSWRQIVRKLRLSFVPFVVVVVVVVVVNHHYLKELEIKLAIM